MLLTNTQLAEIESQTLSPYAVTSSTSQGRHHPESPDQYRTPFQRDRDRVIHSRSFRRLKEKTQVFISGSGDHYRSRLTHTMEVAQISRDVARTLGLNEDLAETIALAHDLGHTPFGHAGETALDEVLKEHGQSFEHNEQSKRVVEILETPYPNFPGLNLTQETIDGLMKHQSPYDNATKTFNFLPSLEAQVVNLADEIAYTAHDIDDGLRSSIITREQLAKLDIWQQACAEACNHYQIASPEELNRDRIISKVISILINDLYQATENSIKENNIDSLEKVHKFPNKIVHFSQQMRQQLAPLRSFLYQDLYFSPKVAEAMKAGQQMIKDLFNHYLQKPESMPERYQTQINNENSKLVAIKDYIAGMTDFYAKAKWQQLIK